MSRNDSAATRRAVYVSYDGLTDPLGQSQVLPYILGLARHGHHVEVISFEKGKTPLHFRRQLQENVRWTALRYHKEPTLPATALDMSQGLATASLIATLSKADLVHARSYVAAAMVLPLVVTRRLPLLFDMRGFWADEKVEGGAWAASGPLYAGTKRIERTLLSRADHVSVLTRAAQVFLRERYEYRSEIRARMGVIPTCVDLELFSPEGPVMADAQGELGDAQVLVYAGSVGTFYLSRQMAEFYLHWRRHFSRARFLVVSTQPPTEVERVLRAAGVEGELVHRSARRDQVPRYLRLAHAGIAFDGRKFAGTGTAPTKLGEMLATGLPVAANAVGDVDRVLGGDSPGVLVKDLSLDGLARSAEALAKVQQEPGTRRAARTLAEKWFSLEAGVAAYSQVYRSMPHRHRDGGAARDDVWVADR